MNAQRTSLPRRLARFFQQESTGGVIMILTAMLALAAASGDNAEWYRQLVSLPIAVSVGTSGVEWTLSHWVNDVLMVFFFFLIGMELKREMAEGVLSDTKRIMLPLVAAVGGMAVPALVYLFINRDLPQHFNGWAIPSATDIAFAVCVLTLVGKSVPSALKIFLLAIAIFDDLGAIIVIALFYNSGLELAPLLLCGVVTTMLWMLNRLRIMAIFPYLAAGVLLWFCLHAAGIHTTLAGVITGFAIPLRNPNENSDSPLATAMHFLHPWVAFFILPLFAFTSAGVDISGLTFEGLLMPLPLSIALGLFFGKQIGIFGGSWLFIKSGFATLPHGCGWRHVYGVSVLAGIGFTMSLFIGGLAFSDPALHDEVKIGVLAGSLLSTFWGWLVLKSAKPSTS